MVYGGLIVSAESAGAFDASINAWRQKHNLRGEFKWTKVSRAKLPRYSSLVKSFFTHASSGTAHFAAVVFDTHEIDYATYHKGSEELGFYKFYYQFLRNKLGRYAVSDDSLLWVFIDQRQSADSVKLGTLRNVLNAGIRKRFGRRTDVVRRVEARVSHDCNLMQVADVLMGAVGFHWNSHHHAPSASPAKLELASQIAKLAGLQSLACECGKGSVAFEIWRFRFSGEKKRSVPRPRP
jgi:hypothetical protein